MTQILSNRRPLEQAVADAEAFRDLFPPTTYARWEIAGSVRRRRATCGDVEHVVIPAFGDVDLGGGLFPQLERVNLLWFHLDALVRKGEVTKHLYGTRGFSWGEVQRGTDWRGFRHEVYTCDADAWGSNLAVRTGPAQLSKRLVESLKHHGYDHCGGYRVMHVQSGEPVPVRDERQYFDLCGVEWTEPERRG